MKTTEAPFCTLPADRLAERLETVRREIVPHVTRVEPGARGVTLELEGGPEVRARLARLVELERECCGGLGWELEGAPDASRLVIDGIDPGELERLGLPLPAASPTPGAAAACETASSDAWRAPARPASSWAPSCAVSCRCRPGCLLTRWRRPEGGPRTRRSARPRAVR